MIRSFGIRAITAHFCILIAVANQGTAAFGDDLVQKSGTQPSFELLDHDQVVLLGATFIERAQRHGHLETAMTAYYPDRTISFRNLGWSGDTVWADSRGIFDPPSVGYKRMIDQLKELKPSVLLMHYGTNESFAGEAQMPKFQTQLNKLLGDIQAIGKPKETRIILVSPHRFETPDPPLPDATQQHPNLQLYTNHLQALSSERKYPFVNLFKPYKTKRALTDNGMHLTAAGYRRIAEVFMQRSGNPYQPEVVSLQVTDNKTGKPIEFKSFASRLPWAGQVVRIKGLSAGKHRLKIDGETIVTESADEFAKGIQIDFGPDQQQLEKLRQAIVKKNRLYFYRWRPQNITYLFGFRKHEQGNNAKDVAEFEPLVKKVEADINQLKKPVERTFTVEPVSGGKS